MYQSTCRVMNPLRGRLWSESCYCIQVHVMSEHVTSRLCPCILASGLHLTALQKPPRPVLVATLACVAATGAWTGIVDVYVCMYPVSPPLCAHSCK